MPFLKVPLYYNTQFMTFCDYRGVINITTEKFIPTARYTTTYNDFIIEYDKKCLIVRDENGTELFRIAKQYINFIVRNYVYCSALYERKIYKINFEEGKLELFYELIDDEEYIELDDHWLCIVNADSRRCIYNDVYYQLKNRPILFLDEDIVRYGSYPDVEFCYIKNGEKITGIPPSTIYFDNNIYISLEQRTLYVYTIEDELIETLPAEALIGVVEGRIFYIGRDKDIRTADLLMMPPK